MHIVKKLKKIGWKRISIIPMALLLFLFGYFSNTLINKYSNSTDTSVNPGLRENDPNYKLIKPLLLCSEKTNFFENKVIAGDINKYINGRIKDGSALDISYYFKDFNNGDWVGVNEDDKYSPASLMKVAVMMAYYKLAETNPSILTNQVLYKANDNLDSSEYFKATSTLKYGNIYTFDELINSMIINSDNNALTVLENFINPNSLNEVYTDLGLPIVQSSTDPAAVDYISADVYSHFFRVLYSATYVNRQLSEKALELLTKSDFNKGIRAGLPTGMTVSSKFGERTILDSKGQVDYRELHDCGIVFNPNHPYLICVMTKGKDYNVLAGIIKDISFMTFNEVGMLK